MLICLSQLFTHLHSLGICSRICQKVQEIHFPRQLVTRGALGWDGKKGENFQLTQAPLVYVFEWKMRIYSFVFQGI